MTTVIKCGQGLHQAYVEAKAGSGMITLFLKVGSTSSHEAQYLLCGHQTPPG